MLTRTKVRANTKFSCNAALELSGQLKVCQTKDAVSP